MLALRDIGTLSRTAYVDLLSIAREMWPVLLVIAALYVLATMGYFGLPMLVGSELGRIVMRLLVVIGCTALAGPYFILLHRYVALGEVRWLPEIDGYDSGLVYVAWAAMAETLWFAPTLIAQTLADFGLEPIAGPLELLCLGGVWATMAALTTLLPMAALHPQRATLRQAFAHTRGRLWYVFAATNGPAAPAFFALVLLGRAAATHSIAPLPFWLLGMTAVLTLQIVPLAVGTRLYLRFSAGG